MQACRLTFKQATPCWYFSSASTSTGTAGPAAAAAAAASDMLVEEVFAVGFLYLRPRECSPKDQGRASLCSRV